MIRIFFFLIILGLVLFAVASGYRWLVRNRVRIRMTRPPTGREILFLSAAFQVLKTMLRLLLRKF